VSEMKCGWAAASCTGTASCAAHGVLQSMLKGLHVNLIRANFS
jgi:hypothetical protein